MGGGFSERLGVEGPRTPKLPRAPLNGDPALKLNHRICLGCWKVRRRRFGSFHFLMLSSSYYITFFPPLLERKRTEENFHSPAEKLEFYSMADLQTKPYLFRPDTSEAQVIGSRFSTSHSPSIVFSLCGLGIRC